MLFALLSFTACEDKTNAEKAAEKMEEKAEDMGEFYRIPADNRDLNYNRYFSEGETDISQIEDYHSHNTNQLSDEELKQTLLNLDFIKENL